jgi:CheY-like chemotaxis protein
MTAAASPLVLVVDDVADTRRLMRRVLERAGIRVTEAATGEDAIEAIARDRPDLVVLDLRLPGISGFEVARWVRASPDPVIARTVLLACSASVQPEVEREALDAGADAFEGKPFDIASFVGRIRQLIAQRPP